MSKLLTAVATVVAVALVAFPAHAEDPSGSTVMQHPQSQVTELARKYPAIAGPVDPPVILVPPDNVVPKEGDAQGSANDAGVAVATGSASPTEGGAFLSPSRQGGSATSREQETRRSLKRLIRRLG